MKFRKKLVVIEAVQFTGQNSGEIKEFCPDTYLSSTGGSPIRTLEGTMTLLEKDWLIKGIAGEYYPCKPDIFDLTYELVE